MNLVDPAGEFSSPPAPILNQSDNECVDSEGEVYPEGSIIIINNPGADVPVDGAWECIGGRWEPTEKPAGGPGPRGRPGPGPRGRPGGREPRGRPQDFEIWQLPVPRLVTLRSTSMLGASIPGRGLLSVTANRCATRRRT